jgi:hypothetical protein
LLIFLFKVNKFANQAVQFDRYRNCTVSPLQGTSGPTVEGLTVGMLLVTRLKEWEINLLLKQNYRGADKSLARPTSRCILLDGENISFDASLVIYI